MFKSMLAGEWEHFKEIAPWVGMRVALIVSAWLVAHVSGRFGITLNQHDLALAVYAVLEYAGKRGAAWASGAKIGLPLALFLLLPGKASASPYFRLNSLTKPVTVAGALVNPAKLGDSSAAVLVPIFTHSPADGCLLAKLGICEAWTPAAVGASINAGKISAEIGPVANVLPWAQKGILALLPAKWEGARAVFQSSAGAAELAAGPMFEYSQARNKGYFVVFAGMALRW